MRKANFFAVFVGIESPDPKMLMHMKKKQNTRRNLADSIHKIQTRHICDCRLYRRFDSEKVSIADASSGVRGRTMERSARRRRRWTESAAVGRRRARAASNGVIDNSAEILQQ